MYAVVIFTSESSKGEKTVNEVPISWLSDDQKFCWWPPANSNLYIARNKMPNEQSWKLHPVVVECMCESLQDAKKKALLISDDESVEGRMRAVKPVSRFSPEPIVVKKKTETQAFRLPPILNIPETPLVDDFTDQMISSIEARSNDISCAVSSEDSNSDVHSDLHTLSSRSHDSINNTAITNNIETNSDVHSDLHTLCSRSQDLINTTAIINNIVTNSDVHTNQSGLLDNTTIVNRIVHDCNTCDKFNIILDLISEININIRAINEKLQRVEKLDQPSEDFPFEFPARSIEELQDIDIKLQNDKYKLSFIAHVGKIGGNSGRDFTYRILKHLLTNELAELCSWTGAKHNYPLQGLLITKHLLEAVQKTFPITKKEFEMHVRDWLRHAKQRKEREEKNKSKN